MRVADLTDCHYVAGWAIIGCPECGKKYRNHVYGFVDLTDVTIWSDGYTRKALYSSWPSVSKCTCGALFLKAKARSVGYIPRAVPEVEDEGPYEIPYFLMSTEKQAEVDKAKRAKAPAAPWWKRLFPWAGDPGTEHGWPTRPRSRKPQTEHLRWPGIPLMDRAAIEAEFARTDSFADRELETALRRDYWWKRNQERRWQKEQLLPLDEMERDNLQRLLDLLRYELDHPRSDDDDVDEPELRASKFWLEIGEIQRELGLFDEALVSFARVGDALRARRVQLEELAQRRSDALVRYDL